MKAKTLITACFAGTGVFLLVTGSMKVLVSLYLVTTVHNDPDNRYLMLAQYLVLSMPFISGLIFLGLAPTLAAVVCRRSKIGEDELARFIQPVVAITVACVISGLTLALSQIPEFAQLVSKQFLAAASPVYASNHPHENYKIIMIRPGIYSAVAVILLWKAKALATWLVSRYESP